MKDTPEITQYLLSMYDEKNSWPTRLNFRAFLRLSGLNRLDRESRILDLGCGTGHLLQMLEQAGFRNLCGVDASPEMVERAKQSVEGRVICYDASEFEQLFTPGSLDAIVICCLLHHIPAEAEWARILSAAAKVLSIGGRLIIREPYPNLMSKMLEALARFPGLHRGFLKPHLEGYKHEKHLIDYFFPRWQLHRHSMIERYGLKIERDMNWWVHRITIAHKL